MGGNCIDFAQLTVSDSVVTLVSDASPVLPAEAKGVIITLEDYGIRWRADGSDPSTTVGHEMADTDILTFDSWTNGVDWRQVLRKLRFIRISSDAKFQISYFD